MNIVKIQNQFAHVNLAHVRKTYVEQSGTDWNIYAEYSNGSSDIIGVFTDEGRANAAETRIWEQASKPGGAGEVIIIDDL